MKCYIQNINNKYEKPYQSKQNQNCEYFHIYKVIPPHLNREREEVKEDKEEDTGVYYFVGGHSKWLYLKSSFRHAQVYNLSFQVRPLTACIHAF